MGLVFDYEPWDISKDVRLARAGNVLGFTAILTSMEIGEMSSVRARKQDTLIRETEIGVIGLLAGAIEWLRWREYTPEEVQSKVRAFKNGNLESNEQAVLKGAQIPIEEISNPRRRKLDTKVLIG